MWNNENNTLVKEFEFSDFLSAVAFVNDVARRAEERSHHPDVLIHSYKNVKIMLRTHEQDAVTEKDHALAEEIDAAFKAVGDTPREA